MNSLPSTISVALPKHLTPGLVARLARDVVMDLKPLSDILEPYCITKVQYERIKEMPFFKRVFEDFTVEWNRVTSTPERVRLISAVLLEEGLPRLGSQMIDKEISPAIAVETGKFFAKMAGVGETKTDGASGEKFIINIDLGGDNKIKFVKDVTPATPGMPESLEQGLPENADIPRVVSATEEGPGLSSPASEKPDAVASLPERESKRQSVDTLHADGGSLLPPKA